MATVQIKTLEQMIIRELCGVNGYNRMAQIAFAQVLQHFSDEGYLYGINHREIIEKIYIYHFYKYRSAYALSRELHIDTKTLLIYRKSYVRLFAKYYLDLDLPTETDLFLLYSGLEQKTALRNDQPRP